MLLQYLWYCKPLRTHGNKPSHTAVSSVIQSGLDPTLAPSDGPPLFEEHKAEVQIFLMRGYP